MVDTFLFLRAEPSAPPGPCFLFDAASAISIDLLKLRLLNETSKKYKMLYEVARTVYFVSSLAIRYGGRVSGTWTLEQIVAEAGYREHILDVGFE